MLKSKQEAIVKKNFKAVMSGMSYGRIYDMCRTARELA